MKGLFKILVKLLGRRKLSFCIFLGILSGLCSFLFINFLTRVVSLLISGTFTSISHEYILIFSAIIVLFIWTRRTLSITLINLSQTLFWELRKQILALVLNSNYHQLSTRKTKIYSALVNDVNTMVNASMSIISFFTALILSLACLIYLATLSIHLFAITIIIASLGVALYHRGAKKNLKQFEEARKLETKFLESFNSILNGFKEIFIEPKKGRFISDTEIKTIAVESFENNNIAFTGLLNNQITGQILFYLLISSTLLIFSVMLNIKPKDIVSYIFTLTYLLGSIETIMVLLPGMLRAKVASNQLLKLRVELESEFNAPTEVLVGPKEPFEFLRITGLEFVYGNSENAFQIGPIDLELRQKEIIFIYGGNGSGKTTLIHSILGLCSPTAGKITLNGSLITENKLPEYRSNFSTVFNDFYLFKGIIGVDEVDIDKWEKYLDLFELKGIVQLDSHLYSTTDLSTGQRKRLALITALLEAKPVLILDEWAADQDPQFRKKFYTEILPLLKEEGVSIVAITHDDKYYYCSDKLYKMDYGRLIQEET